MTDSDWNIIPSCAGEIDFDNLQQIADREAEDTSKYDELTREEEKKMLSSLAAEEARIIHKFPMTIRASTHIAVLGAKIISAQLEVYGNCIAKCVPTYASDWSKTDSVKIDFFGGVPFHAQFVNPGAAVVVLHCTEDTPSLQFYIDETTDPQWMVCEDGMKYYMEKVVPSPLDQEYYLFYGAGICGLKPIGV